MLFILAWILYGFVVGCLAKMIHQGEDPVGFLPTVGIGIVGSYIGGLINWLIGAGGHPFSPSGIVMGTIGGVIFCWAYRKYHLEQFLSAQNKSDE